MKNFNNYFKLVVLSGFLLSIIAFVSCSNNDSPSNDSRTYQEVKEDFGSIVFTEGINDISLESTLKNFFWDFRVIIPEGASNTNKRPLIISLHGAALSLSPDIHKATACLVEPGFNDIEPIIISPNSKGFLWQEDTSQFQILSLLDFALTYLQVDPNKVVITGYSDGGNGTWFYADFYPELFSAAIPMASSHDTSNGLGSYVIYNIPMYVIHGSDDELFSVDLTEGYVNNSINVGSEIEFVIADGLTHNNSCDYVPYLKDAASWLETTVWL